MLLLCFAMFLQCFSQVAMFCYSKTLNNRTGPHNESLGGPGGPGTGLCGPGGGFLLLVDVVACHYIYHH